MGTKNLSNYWWIVLIRGIVAIIFAFLALFWTGFTLELIVIFFGVYALLDGIFAIFAAIKAIANHRKWWLLLLEGIIGIVVAITVFSWPVLTAVVFVYLIAIWAILTGILEFFVGLAAPWEAIGKWLVIFTGILSIILGVIMLSMPLISIVLLIWLVGIYALVAGLMLVIFSFQLKSIK
ncbi:MAG: HdeD family acid-resistance protein [Patescibacteria group bacterium]|jgi:uncharacterized membrane protein HdeD (DUF308 family)